MHAWGLEASQAFKYLLHQLIKEIQGVDRAIQVANNKWCRELNTKCTWKYVKQSEWSPLLLMKTYNKPVS